jgi:Right handed beta helix region
VIRGSTLVRNGRSGINWEVSGDALDGDHALIKNNRIRNNGWNTDGPPSPWAGIIINDASNIEIVGNTFGGNDVGPDSGETRAIQIYEGTRNPEPTHDVYIQDNVLNGDRIQSCTSTGVTCDQGGHSSTS